LSVRPGITSWASIQFRHEEQLLRAGDVDELYRTQVMPQKLALEMDYLARRSLALDLIILFRTAGALFS
jgi:lipopolysaccharide/colanic/teichoic acid biosynthesis glycosyltransferase